MIKKKIVHWFVNVTHGWNKEFHGAIEANIASEFKKIFPNVKDLSEIEARKEKMRAFYYARMANTATLLVAIAAAVIGLAALVAAVLPLFLATKPIASVTTHLPELSCIIDWPGTASFFKDIVVAIAAIFTAFVAYKGISKWRSEESGKADFELSRRIGKSIFRMRDVMSNARAPFVSAGEFPDGYSPINAAVEEKASAWAHVFNERWIPVRDCAIEIQALRNEAEALWGEAIIPMLDVMLRIANKLRVAMGAYVRNEGANGEHFQRRPDYRKQIDSQVFDMGNEIKENGTEGDPNAMTAEIEKVVSEVATYLRTKLPQRA